MTRTQTFRSILTFGRTDAGIGRGLGSILVLGLGLGCAPIPSEESEDCAGLYYENFGENFLRENCQGCHASTAQDREGAPVGISFDSRADVLTHLPAIISEMQEGTMPPAGGVPEEEHAAFELWLSCVEDQ